MNAFQTLGEEVRFLPTKQIGTVERILNDGALAVIRIGANVLTALADECSPASEPPDPLEELVASAPVNGPIYKQRKQ